MITDIDNQYPFTSTPRPKAQIRVGAYANGDLQIVIPCTTEREATGIGKALESQGYQVRIRAGASLPDTLADESE